MAGKTDRKRWVKGVKTVSTFPPEGLFTKDAETIARVMASKKVSPKGPGSAIRMIQFFINRLGKNLPPRGKKPSWTRPSGCCASASASGPRANERTGDVPGSQPTASTTDNGP